MGSQQQPLAQWIHDRQKAFAEFAHQPALFQDPFDYQLNWQGRNLPTPPTSKLQAYSTPKKMNSEVALSPKAKVSYDEGQFVVEIPLKDYRPEELSVKTEGDVLVILAKHETQTETGGSFVSKQFEQRFSLPSGVKPESIISALGRDGTLKVTAPRTSSQQANLSFKKTRGSLEEEVPNRAETTQNPANQGLPHPKVTYDDDKFLVSLDCKHFKPEELDVKVDGNTIVIVAKQEVKEAGGTRTRVFEQKFTLPNGVQAERVTSTINTDGVLTINAPKGKPASTASVSQSIEQKMDKILSPSSWPDHSLGSMDDFNDNSNSRAYVDGDMYNIDINVQQFKPEELVIKTVGQTVQVEAKHEEKTSDGASYSTRNFSQSFTLPRGVDPESVASSLSKDGKLTIKAPMPKANKISSNERLVPIKHNWDL